MKTDYKRAVEKYLYWRNKKGGDNDSESLAGSVKSAPMDDKIENSHLNDQLQFIEDFASWQKFDPEKDSLSDQMYHTLSFW